MTAILKVLSLSASAAVLLSGCVVNPGQMQQPAPMSSSSPAYMLTPATPAQSMQGDSMQGQAMYKTTPTKSMDVVQTFKCDNGATPSIRILNDQQVQFTTPLGDSTPTVMNLQRSGSGALYVATSGIYGKGGTWHQKGSNEALFDYYDVGSPAKCMRIR